MSASVGFWLAAEGPRVLRALRQDRDGIEAVARGRLTRLLEEVSHNAYYGPLLPRGGESAFERLSAVPPSTKELLRAAGPALLRGGRPQTSWRSTRSSGSTGEPFRVYYEPRAWAILRHLVKVRARWSCGARAGQRVAIVDTPAEQGGEPSPARGWPIRRISALQPGGKIAGELAVFHPDVVYGLPSVLLEAAVSAGGPIRAGRLFTSGELLTPAVRRKLEAAYHCRVYDVYGSTETKEIAWECREGNRHVNADVLHVEILDDAGVPVAEGTEGRITVTVLVNAAMPLLRYQPGDRGVLATGAPCPCGLALPVLGVVSGREVEYLDLGGGPRVSPYQLTCAIENVPGLGRFQVVQRDTRDIVVRAEPLGGADPVQLTERLREAVASALPVLVNLDVLLEARIGPAAAGKFQVVLPMARPRAQGAG